jgi:hypothetical protein
MAGDETKKGKGCLIGCLTVIGIFVVAVIIIALIVVFQGEDILMSVLAQAKVGTAYLLTEDHTDEEKARFQDAFSEVVNEIRVAGFTEGTKNNKGLIYELQNIIEDRRITRDESTRWIQLYLEGPRDVVPEDAQWGK